MPGGSVRVGGAHVTFSADATRYTAGTRQAIAANRQYRASFAGMNVALDRFRTSVSSSLVATAAYVAGVGSVSAALSATTTGFLDYDQALIRISKTTGVVEQDLERLGQSLERVNTRGTDGRRAIDISRRDLFSIAQAAGQAGVTEVRDIERLSRASAALQSSSDLIGTEAVRALTKYLQVTNQGIEQTDAIASAFTHLGNNIVGTESEISRFSVRVAQNLTAVGKQTDEFILGVSATLLEAGVEQEAAGSALQRAQLAVIRSAGNEERFAFLAQQTGQAADQFEALRQRFVDGTASAADYDRALKAVLETYASLPEVGTDETLSRQAFLAEVIGGGEANVRNTRVLAALANRYPRLIRNIELANEALRDQDAHYEEAGRASEAYRARLGVVGRQLQAQAKDVGSVLVPALVALAEQYQFIEVAAVAAGVALASGFGRRRILAFQQGTAALADQIAAQRIAVLQSRNAGVEASRNLASRRGAVNVALAGGGTASPAQLRAVERANTRVVRSLERTQEATRRLNDLQAVAARRAFTVRNTFRALGAGILSFAGGPVGLAITAVAALAGVLLVLRARAREADAAVDDLGARVDDFVEGAGRGALTPAGTLIRDLNAEIDASEARIESALARVPTGGGQSRAAERRTIAAEIERERFLQERLAEQIERVREAEQERREAAEEAERVVGGEFSEVAKGLTEAVIAVKDLERAQARTVAQLEDEAQRRLRLARLSEADRDREIFAAERQIEVTNALADAQEAQANNALRIQSAEGRLARARSIREQTDIDTEARRLADEQVETIEEELEAHQQVSRELRLQIRLLAALNQQFGPEYVESLREIFETLRLAEVEESRRPTIPQPPDIAGAERRARQELVDLERETLEISAEVRREQEARAAASARLEVGVRARQEVEVEYERRRLEAQDALVSARAELAQAEGRYRDAVQDVADAAGQVTDAQISYESSTRSATEAARRGVAEAEAYARAVESQAEAVRELAREQERATSEAFRNSLQELAIDVGRLNDRFIDATANGLTRFEDALLNVFETGKLGVRELATAIAQDLLRALIRVTITARLAQAALTFIPGFGGVGGLGLFHSGGIAGQPRQFRNLSAGLRPRETLAVLEKDEEIITRRDPRHRWNLQQSGWPDVRAWLGTITRYHQGGIAGGPSGGPGGMGGGMNVRLELINQSSGRLEAVDNGVRMDLDGLVVSAILRDVSRNGDIAQAVRGLR